MFFGIFSLHYAGASGEMTLLTFKRGFEGTMADLMASEDSFKKENLFFCPFEVALGKPGSGWKPSEKDFKSSEWLTIDIDGIEETGGDTHADTVRAVETFLPKDPNGERFYIWSGNGLQAFFRIPRQTIKFYRRTNRVRYGHFARLLSDHLIGSGILFSEVDTRIFEPTRLHRLPGTINNKPKKGPKKAILLDAINENGEVNNNLLEWFFSLPDEPERPTAPVSIEKPKIEEFLQGIGASPRGKYWLMSCPFHRPDEKPSFAYYPDIDRGVDFHCERGDVNRVKKFEEIYLAITGKTLDQYREEFGIKKLEDAEEIIKRFLMVEFKPTHFTRQGLFMAAIDATMTLKAVQESPTKEIIEQLKESVEFFAKKEKSPKSDDFDIAVAIYRSRSMLAFSQLRKELPIENHITAKNREPKVLVRRIQALLHKTITISIDSDGLIAGLGRENAGGPRQHLKKCSIVSYANLIAVADGDGWSRIGHLEAFTKLDKNGKIFIAIRYVLLADLDKTWYEDFSSSRDFSTTMKKIGAGILRSIFIDGKTVRAIVLNPKFYNQKQSTNEKAPVSGQGFQVVG